MAMGLVHGIIWALCFSIPTGILLLVKSEEDDRAMAALSGAVATFVVLTFINFFIFFRDRPVMTFVGMYPILFVELGIALIVAIIADIWTESISAATVVGVLLMVALTVFFIVEYNSDHNAYAASHIVSVTVENRNLPPASNTSNLVIVSPDIATTKAQQTMTTGVAGQRNYSTYLNLASPSLQYVDGQMWYLFPLQFDGSGNKHRLHGIEPGYIMVSAENPNATPVEHYDGQYSMLVSSGAGQGAEPLRWAYDHGYSGYLMDSPIFTVNDQGQPYWTIALMEPKLGWTFWAPVAALVINAHNGDMTKYSLNDLPSWVDRVYTPQMAEQIANWYGMYANANFKGPFGLGSTNANRFQVSGEPILVYTGAPQPDWRMLLTSFNNDNSVSKIVLMNAQTGAMRIYTPQEPMGIEEPVYEAFDSASGVGAQQIKANQYNATDLTLHVIFGHLTWMATYEASGDNPSFVGLGFVDAYHTQANNVAFGSNKAQALQNYLTQLASESTANGSQPGQGAAYKIISGVIAPNGVNWDESGGQKYWYISLKGDANQIFEGTVSNLGPALVVAQPGDPVIIRYLVVTTKQSVLTMDSFTDKLHAGLSSAGT